MLTSTPKTHNLHQNTEIPSELRNEIIDFDRNMEIYSENFWTAKNEGIWNVHAESGDGFWNLANDDFARGDFHSTVARLQHRKGDIFDTSRKRLTHSEIVGDNFSWLQEDPVASAHVEAARVSNPDFYNNFKTMLNPKNIGVGLGSAWLANRAVNWTEDLTGMHMQAFPKTAVEGAAMGGLNWAGLAAMGAETAGFIPEMAAGATFYGARYMGQKALDFVGVDEGSWLNEIGSDALAGAAAGGLMGGGLGAGLGAIAGAGFGLISKGFESLFG